MYCSLVDKEASAVQAPNLAQEPPAIGRSAALKRRMRGTDNLTVVVENIVPILGERT